MNFIDRIVSAVSPQSGVKRAVAREQMRVISDARMDYNAASRGHRTAGWRAGATGAITEVGRARDRLRFVGRDMVRNNPIAARVPLVVSQNVVGKGIIPNAISLNPETKKTVERLLKNHFDTTACDYNGQLDLYGIQALIAKMLPTDGEVFVLKHMLRSPKRGTLPLQLQVLEADFLDTTKNTISGKPGKSRIIQGIQFDARGKREGYWFYREHPGDAISIHGRRSHFYPANRVCHIYRIDRPGQIMGASWFAPVAVRMADLHDFADARLYREKIAGAFTAFVKRTDEAGLGITGSKDKSYSRYPLEEITPGIIEHLDHGDDITFGSPPQTDGYKEYWSAGALEISMGLGISYAGLTGDMSQGNFSSNRMGWLEDQRFYEAIRSGVLFGQFLDPLTGWTKDSLNAMAVLSDFHLGWTAPARDMIDPARDTKADLSAIEGGIESLQNIQRKRGRDPEDIHEERLEDAHRQKSLDTINADKPPEKKESQNDTPAN